MADGLRQVAALPDPVGEVTDGWAAPTAPWLPRWAHPGRVRHQLDHWGEIASGGSGGGCDGDGVTELLELTGEPASLPLGVMPLGVVVGAHLQGW
jgi:hypothetical protein